MVPTIKKIAVVVFALTLIACGDGDGGSSQQSPSPNPTPNPNPNPNPEIELTELASLPEKSLEYRYAGNQQMIVDAFDNIYLRREDLYKQERNENITAGSLYILGLNSNTWGKATFDSPISTPPAIRPWGVGDMYAPLFEGSGNKVYAIQAYKICSATLNSLNFTCKNNEKLGLGKTSGLKTLLSVEPNVNYYTSNSTFDAIAVSKSDRNNWIIGQDNGDIEETYDFGKTFTKLRSYSGKFEDNAFEYRVRKINYVLNNPNTYYAATAEGVLKSQNSGRTWDLVNQGKKRSVSTSNNGQFIIAVADESNDGELNYSKDYGETWETAYIGKITNSRTIMIGSDSSKKKDGTFYLFDSKKVYKVEIK